MELKEFIEETLVQVFEGVKAAQEKTQGWGDGTINPFDKDNTDVEGRLIYSEYTDKRFIDFEVSLTKTDTSEKDGGVGAKIAVYFGEFSIKGKEKTKNENTSFNKVKFSIPVFYPVNKTR